MESAKKTNKLEVQTIRMKDLLTTARSQAERSSPPVRAVA